jgi:PAS domain-containing protein
MHVDGDVAGGALLLRSAWVLRDAARERTEAIAAKERYQALFERVPMGLYRTTPTGKILDVNSAMVEILRFPDAQSLLGVDARSLWVNPDQRLHLVDGHPRRAPHR